MLYSVAGSGIIRLRKLRNGDMAVARIGKGDLADIINKLCTRDRGYWHHGYGEWVIRSSRIPEAIAELNRLAIPLEQVAE